MDHDLLTTVLLLAGGQIVLALVALRVAWWVARGWRDAFAPGDPPPAGPGGGRRAALAAIEAGAAADPAKTQRLAA